MYSPAPMTPPEGLDERPHRDARGRLLRCPACALHVPSCICAECTKIAVRTRVVVLCHAKEIHKPSNTGRLVPLLLECGEVRRIGGRDEPLDTRGFDDPARRVLLLYPSADSRELSADDAIGAPITLVVPDSDWRRAHKMTSRNQDLAPLPRVHVPLGAPSIYRLRYHPDPRFLATFEAIARALAILEGLEVEERLMRVLRLMVERGLDARGYRTGQRPALGGPRSKDRRS